MRSLERAERQQPQLDGVMRRSAAPSLLVAFFAATLLMVLALALLFRDADDWTDFVAVGLLVAVSALFLAALGRQLGDQEPPEDDERRAGR
jgi:hypothetical protein